MAVRTTLEAVIEVLDKQYDSSRASTLTRQMAIASSFVDAVVTCAATFGVVHDDVVLEQLESLIAAHLYTLADPMYKEKQTERAKAVYNIDPKAEGFLGIAKQLDTTGCLAKIMTKKQRASVEWLGLNPIDQTDYIDRAY